MSEEDVSYERVRNEINSDLKELQSRSLPKSTAALLERYDRLMLRAVDLHYRYEVPPEEGRKARQHRGRAVAALRELREAVRK